MIAVSELQGLMLPVYDRTRCSDLVSTALISVGLFATDRLTVIIDRSLEEIERNGESSSLSNVTTLGGGQELITPKTEIPDKAGKCG